MILSNPVSLYDIKKVWNKIKRIMGTSISTKNSTLKTEPSMGTRKDSQSMEGKP